MSEFDGLDGLAMAHLVRTGQVTPAELLEDAIARVEEANPAVNAVITPLYDQARAEVRGALSEGPFQGVPFLLKDGGAVGVAGTRLTSGSRYLMDNISKEDGELYLRYKAAGLVAFGKTNMPEFGLQPTTEPEAHGPTRNPWNLGLTAGGSSGGAAAAVATRMVPIAHASDSGGSIRIPASCCGVFGMKPTRLRITSSRRHLGVSARMSFLSENAISLSVRDSAALLDASAGPGFADPFQAPRPERPYLDEMGREPGRLRIVVSNESPTGAPLDEHAVAAVEDAARLCESLGHHVEYGVPRLDVGGIAGPFAAVTSHGLAWDIARLERQTGKVALEEHFETATWDLIQRGRNSTTTIAEYTDGLAALQALSEEVQRFQQPYDIWLTPTAGTAPPPLGSFTSTPEDPTRGMRASASYLPFTTLINVTGQPAMSVPLYWTADDVPVGAHFVAPYGDEGLLFRLAAQLEAARPWAHRKPPTHPEEKQ